MSIEAESHIDSCIDSRVSLSTKSISHEVVKDCEETHTSWQEQCGEIGEKETVFE